MNTELFIAGRMLSQSKSSFSRPFVRIAIVGVALGLAIMFISIAILTGFQIQVREKVCGFAGQIRISHFEENTSYEPKPISSAQDFLPRLKQMKGIRHIQVFATKAGIIKTKDQIEGVMLKGIGSDYDWSFFSNKMAEGSHIVIPDTGKTNDVMISRGLASLLKLRLHDDLRMYFISGDATLARKFNIAGIYETGLGEFDKLFIFCDIRHIEKLNNWNPDQVGGFEILVSDFNDIDRMGSAIYHMTGFSLDARTIKQLYPQIFDWLGLQDINVLIILVLMILVSGITMISTLLILILEQTAMIGILKTLGMHNRNIRKIFLYTAIYITGIGMLWGNIAGFVLCFLQQKWGIVPLPQESYYVPVVPINLDALNIILLNAGTLVICFLMLIMPSYMITRISPIRAIRFD